MEQQKSDEKAQPKKSLYLESNLLIVFGVTLMAVLGVASITPAFPTMSSALGIPMEAIGLLITIFTIPGVLFTPFLGILADRFGRRTILVPSLFLFGIAGFANAFAWDFTVLLFFRFFQGLGAASLGALNVTIIGDLYAGKDRVDAMAYNASVTSIGTAIYPAIGGALALLGWFYPFYLPLIAIPIGITILFWLKNPEPRDEVSFQRYLGRTWQIVKDRRVGGLLLASTVAFIMLYGAIITYLPYVLSISFGANALIRGAMQSSLSIAAAITATMVGRLTERFSERKLILIAFPLYALGLFLIPFSPSLVILLIPISFFGIAQALNMPSIQTLLAGLAPPAERAALMSLNGWILRVGQTLGPIFMGYVLLFWGLPSIYWFGALLGILIVPILFVTIPSSKKSM